MIGGKIKMLVKVLCILLFFWVCPKSWAKFRSGRESSDIRQIDIQEVQYPSVSVCVENALKSVVDITHQSNLSFDETSYLVKKSVWKRNETFFFVNQPSIASQGHPSMTTKESQNPGRPCSFPYYYKHLHYNCTNLTSKGHPWCYIKVKEDGSNKTRLRIFGVIVAQNAMLKCLNLLANAILQTKSF